MPCRWGAGPPLPLRAAASGPLGDLAPPWALSTPKSIPPSELWHPLQHGHPTRGPGAEEADEPQGWGSVLSCESACSLGWWYGGAWRGFGKHPPRRWEDGVKRLSRLETESWVWRVDPRNSPLRLCRPSPYHGSVPLDPPQPWALVPLRTGSSTVAVTHCPRQVTRSPRPDSGPVCGLPQQPGVASPEKEPGAPTQLPAVPRGGSRALGPPDSSLQMQRDEGPHAFPTSEAHAGQWGPGWP